MLSFLVIPIFGTGDFLMMKYEAKAYDTQTSAVVTDGGFAAGSDWAGLIIKLVIKQFLLVMDGRGFTLLSQRELILMLLRLVRLSLLVLPTLI